MEHQPLRTAPKYHRERLQLAKELCAAQLRDAGLTDSRAQAFVQTALESIAAALRLPCYR
jgi:hypothetical protein